MTTPKTSNLKKSLIATISTVTLGGLALGLVPEARSESFSNRNAEITQNQDQLIAAASKSLKPTTNDGTPDGYSEQEWTRAKANATVTDVNADSYTVEVEASNLVPNGLYTIWYVNEKLVGMDMGPAGGTPENEFRADSEGNATATITVSKDNGYQMMGLAYHADNQTHGEMPGEFGTQTFTHFMGEFVKPSN